MRKKFIILMVPIVFCACSTVKIPVAEKLNFNTLNKIEYPSNTLTDKDNGYKKISDYLNAQEINEFEIWKNQQVFLENFMDTECIGCSNKWGDFTPIYKVKKGNFVHFGFKKYMGIENLTFKKNGKFISQFYTYQGYSKSEYKQEAQNATSVITSIYPIYFDDEHISLKHIEYSNQTENEGWFNTLFPKKLEYDIQLTEKQPKIRFMFRGGLYSHQDKDALGEYRYVNFFEPEFVANVVNLSDEMPSFSAYQDAYYGIGTFFLFSVEEEMDVSIEINSKIKDETFVFSVFKNDSFYTIEDYLQRKGKDYKKYQNQLKKGEYLIRVISSKRNYWPDACFGIKIKKTTLK